jgi:hypothetical protein
MQNSANFSYESIALQFTQHLLEAKFTDAYAMLSADLKESLDLAELQNTYENMVNYPDDSVITAEVMETMLDWPDKQANDIGWAYVAISGKTFSEAVAVIIENTAEDMLIRSIEWGRP